MIKPLRKKKKVAIIGSGFSGLSAAAYIAQSGHDVHVFERHSQPGGRARQFNSPQGYVFDMGPSWYWMPDIIESFFSDFGHKPSDFYDLISLNPQFELIFSENNLAIPKDYESLKALFEELEPGAGRQLDKFMQAAKYKYEVGMQDFVNKPCYSWMEFISSKTIKSAGKLNLLTNFRSYVSKYFKHPQIRTLMEFPVIFLGASPKEIPALYSLMNYGGYVLGTHYPLGGFYVLVLAMQKVAEKQGANFHFNQNIDKINISNGKVASIEVNGKSLDFDAVVAACDYHHAETLLPEKYKNYDDKYWENRTFAPSSLIFYLGFKEKIPGIKHHSLFFEEDLDEHLDTIYKNKSWPEKPLFYCCCPSKTDTTVAPKGGENLFLLMPLALGLADDQSKRKKYLHQMLARIEKHTDTKNLLSKIEYQKSYCISDFMDDYSAYGGNAYGLANTLEQTAVLKPKIKNRKLGNLFYAGQLTVPGPGVPPSIISGKIVAQEVIKLKTFSDETVI